VIYPALIATGVSPQLAAVSNLASIMPATMLAALSNRTQLPPFNRAFVGLIAASIIGAGAGAAVLLLTPERMFADRAIVTRFCDAAVRLVGTDQWLAPCPRGGARPCNCVRPRQPQGGAAGLILWWLLLAPGAGILMLGVFSLATGGDYCSANVAKNFFSSLNGFAATLVFATQGAVLWPQTLALGAGTIAGGLIGAYVARVIPRNVVRVLVVVVGAALTIAFARHYWFSRARATTRWCLRYAPVPPRARSSRCPL
jgi:uncharacterized protein